VACPANITAMQRASCVKADLRMVKIKGQPVQGPLDCGLVHDMPVCDMPARQLMWGEVGEDAQEMATDRGRRRGCGRRQEGQVPCRLFLQILHPEDAMRGRWPRSEHKRARRRQQLSQAAEYKKALDRQSGFNRSEGAASKGRVLDRNGSEFAEIARNMEKHEATISIRRPSGRCSIGISLIGTRRHLVCGV